MSLIIGRQYELLFRNAEKLSTQLTNSIELNNRYNNEDSIDIKVSVNQKLSDDANSGTLVILNPPKRILDFVKNKGVVLQIRLGFTVDSLSFDVSDILQNMSTVGVFAITGQTKKRDSSGNEEYTFNIVDNNFSQLINLARQVRRDTFPSNTPFINILQAISSRMNATLSSEFLEYLGADANTLSPRRFTVTGTNMQNFTTIMAVLNKDFAFDSGVFIPPITDNSAANLLNNQILSRANGLCSDVALGIPFKFPAKAKKNKSNEVKKEPEVRETIEFRHFFMPTLKLGQYVTIPNSLDGLDFKSDFSGKTYKIHEIDLQWSNKTGNNIIDVKAFDLRTYLG